MIPRCPHCRVSVFITDGASLTIGRALIRHWAGGCPRVPEDLKEACVEHLEAYGDMNQEVG